MGGRIGGTLLRGFGLLLAYVLLTVLFVLAGFPYDRIQPRIQGELERATGARVTIGTIDSGLSPLGPTLRAANVDLAWPDGFALRVAHADVRPAWSLAWLQGRPAIAIDLESNVGRIDGTARLGSAPGFSGSVEGLVLEQIPAEALEGLGLTGQLDAELDVDYAEQQLAGTIELSAGEGSLSLPDLPVGLPYESFRIDLELGGETLATVHALELDGPMLAGSGSGTVGRAPVMRRAPLQLDLQIEAREPAVHQMLRSQGVAVDKAGSARVLVGGTLGRPELRAAPNARAG